MYVHLLTLRGGKGKGRIKQETHAIKGGWLETWVKYLPLFTNKRRLCVGNTRAVFQNRHKKRDNNIIFNLFTNDIDAILNII